MSLINDALKRAKQAQDKSVPPTAAGASMRPAETTPVKAPGMGILMPLFIGAILVLVGGALVWMAMTRNGEKKAAATSATTNAVASAEVAGSTATTEADEAKKANESSAPAVVAASVELPNTAAGAANALTNAVVDTTPKLQGIMYRAKQPVAVVNGKNVMVGSKLGEYQVVAIEQQSVTVVKAGVTNVLTLPD